MARNWEFHWMVSILVAFFKSLLIVYFSIKKVKETILGSHKVSLEWVSRLWCFGVLKREVSGLWALGRCGSMLGFVE